MRFDRSELAIYNWGTLRQYDFNSDGIATDQVFNKTSGLGTRPVTSAFLSGGYSYFVLNSGVAAGSYVGGGESSFFFAWSPTRRRSCARSGSTSTAAGSQ
jgi:hypothetical protein